MDRNHNPEFTMIELYWAYADYQDVMKLYQRMITTVATKVLGTTKITFGDNQIELGGEWRVLPMLDGISEAVGRDISQMDEPALRKFCDEIGVKTEGLVGRGKLIDELFSEKTRTQVDSADFHHRLSQRVVAVGKAASQQRRIDGTI